MWRHALWSVVVGSIFTYHKHKTCHFPSTSDFLLLFICTVLMYCKKLVCAVLVMLVSTLQVKNCSVIRIIFIINTKPARNKIELSSSLNLNVRFLKILIILIIVNYKLVLWTKMVLTVRSFSLIILPGLESFHYYIRSHIIGYFKPFPDGSVTDQPQYWG